MGLFDWLKGTSTHKPSIKVWEGRPPYDEVDAIYQTENCSAHTYYVATKRPHGNGKWCSIGNEVKLSGTGHNTEWAENLEELFSGDKRWIAFKGDFNNKFNSNAIEVYGIWTDRSSEALIKKRIGWVGAEFNKDLAERLKKTTLIGIPNVFYLGKKNPGLRFRVYYDMVKQNKSYDLIINSLLGSEGLSAAEVAAKSGFKQSEIRNWLEKLSSGQIVTKSLMETCSGYRIERIKKGRNVFYTAVKDDTKIYTAKKKGWTEEDEANDPMGAEVPDYVLEPI